MLDSPKRVTLAIDTDAEFWGLFRNSKRATDYVALLVGCEWRAGGVASLGMWPGARSCAMQTVPAQYAPHSGEH